MLVGREYTTVERYYTQAKFLQARLQTTLVWLEAEAELSHDETRRFIQHFSNSSGECKMTFGLLKVLFPATTMLGPTANLLGRILWSHSAEDLSRWFADDRFTVTGCDILTGRNYFIGRYRLVMCAFRLHQITLALLA